MIGELIAIAILLVVVAAVIAFATDRTDIFTGGALVVALATVVFFLNGWLFMLAVGNLGLPFGYWDSACTAGLLGSCFTGIGASVRASSR